MRVVYAYCALPLRKSEILELFKYSHLPIEVQMVAEPFCELAHVLSAETYGSDSLRGLHSLLDARDHFVKAVEAMRLVKKEIVLPSKKDDSPR